MEENTNTTHVMSEIDCKIKISDVTMMKYELEIQIIELSLETDPKNKNLQKERLVLQVKQADEKINNIKLRYQKLKETNQSEEPPKKKQKKIHTLNVQESQEEDTNDWTYQDEQEEEEEEEENENEDDEQEEEEDDEQDAISNSKIQTRSMSINKEEKERIEQERFLQDTTPRYPRRSNSKTPNQK
jgi:hypothetical protein